MMQTNISNTIHLWFYRSQFWYWTPKKPEREINSEPEEQVWRRSNWMRISEDDDIKVIGGDLNGGVPDDKNVEIIRYLQRYGDDFIL